MEWENIGRTEYIGISIHFDALQDELVTKARRKQDIHAQDWDPQWHTRAGRHKRALMAEIAHPRRKTSTVEWL